MENARRYKGACRHQGFRKAPRRSAFVGALTACRILLVLLLLVSTPARAETPQGCLNGEWIKEVTQFVVEETRSQVPEICVRFAGMEQLNALVLSAVAGRSHGETVAALYVPSTREILLAHDLDPATVLARSYLAHELVHAQQFGRGTHERASCSGALEGEAYNLQALYLRTYTSNHDDEAFLFQLLGMLQSACGSTY